MLERRREFALEVLDAARLELNTARARLAWLVASPAVLGALMLIFIVVAWGVFDLVEPSGTTSTAIVVGAVLVLLPAALATLRGTTAAEQAQAVFEHTEELFKPSGEMDADGR